MALTVFLFSLIAQAAVGSTDWPADLTGAISQQDCLANFSNGRFIEVSLNSNKSAKFDLFYFSAKPVNKQLPTLLYIDGGPGQAVGAGFNTLRFANLQNFNVVYFHPRGVGCSVLPASNEFDVTISTEQTVRDLEIIRQDLGLAQWSMVFGLSYGTITGLKYAEMYPSSLQHLVFEGLFNPSLPRDKVGLAFDKGFPTLMAVYQSWPEYKDLPAEKTKFISEQILALFQTGKAVTSQNVELTDQQVNALVVTLFTTTYQGVYSPGSLNKNGVYNAANALLRLFYPLSQLPTLPKANYESANDLPFRSMRVYANTSINDSLEIDFIEALADPKKDLAAVVGEFYGDLLPYLALDTTKKYSIISLPSSLASHIQFTLLLGTDDGATPYENAAAYLQSLQSSYMLYGLKGFGHQRHFDDACYVRVIEQIYSNQKLDSLFADTTSSCFLPEGFVR